MAMKPRFARCACFYNKNIFVPSVKRHLHYENDEQFSKDFGGLLDLDPELINKVKSEIERRKAFAQGVVGRQKFIAQNYKRKHENIFQLNTQWLDKQFIDFHTMVQKEQISKIPEHYNLLKNSGTNTGFQLYQFPVLTPKFCDLLVEELEHFQTSGMPIEKPNTMNNYGVSTYYAYEILLLDEIGFQGFMDDLRFTYLNDIAKAAFPNWVGSVLDSHRSFTVSYSPDTDKDLSLHFDNAEVTINIALTDTSGYTGGELVFMGMQDEPMSSMQSCLPIKHRKGYGILHRGRQFHAALPVENGTRTNVILWMRSSEVRSRLCPMCGRKPNLIAVQTDPVVNDYGDGFIIHDDETVVDICSLQ